MPTGTEEALPKSTAVKATVEVPHGIFKLLTREHRRIAALFLRLRVSSDPEVRTRMFPKIRSQLLAHEQRESQLLYPAFMGHAELEEKSRAHEAEARAIEQLLDRLRATSCEDDSWIGMFDELVVVFSRHTEEEEKTSFRVAQRVLGREEAECLEQKYKERATIRMERQSQRESPMATQPQPRSNAKLYDVQQVRREASQSILDGAITADYPLDLRRAHELMNEALASEIVCVLRYRHHEIVAKGIDYPQVAAEFAEHAEDEQRHMMDIATRIDELGGEPDFNPATVAARSTTEYGTAGALTKMIREDLVAERVVIEVYRRLVRWFGNDDPTSRRMFEKILADEEEHASDLADLLADVEARSESGR